MKLKWILLSALMGIFAAVLLVMAYKIRTPAWIIGTAGFIAGFLFFIFRNPEFWYRRMAASLIFAWIALSTIPLTAINAAIRDYFNIEFEFKPPTPIYHIGFVVIISVLVIVDFLMRTRKPVESPKSPKRPAASLSKKEKEETIKKVKETVTAVIERSPLSAKQKTKLLNDIDFTLGQVTYHLRSGKKKLTLQAPVFTAVRQPFAFVWDVSESAPKPQYRLEVRAMDDPQSVLLETRELQSKLPAPQELLDQLKPDTWYAWSVEVLDSNQKRLASSDSHAQRDKYRFKLFAHDTILKPLIREFKNQSTLEPADQHAALALIYEAFELRDEALRELEHALQLDAQYAYAKQIRQRILHAQGKPESAAPQGRQVRRPH